MQIIVRVKKIEQFYSRNGKRNILMSFLHFQFHREVFSKASCTKTLHMFKTISSAVILDEIRNMHKTNKLKNVNFNICFWLQWS